jgi:hypothetical protein
MYGFLAERRTCREGYAVLGLKLTPGPSLCVVDTDVEEMRRAAAFAAKAIT